MGIVGIELVAWIIYCGAQTYKARAQRYRAHGRKLVNATSCWTPILGSFTAGEVVEMRGTTQMFLSSARLVAFYEKVINVKADVAAVLVLAKLSTGVTAV
jgi:hypothetical protein